MGPPPAKISPVVPKVTMEKVDLKGWRDILVAEGPQAWAKAVRKHKGMLLTDTTM